MSSTVEQIKTRLSILDVVQSYMALQKAGANYKARCPFHSEKSPSFFVSPSRDSYHCFGCGKSGDVFSFVMEMEGVDFLEALKVLADRAGVEIEKFDEKARTQKNSLIGLMEDARKFYQIELKKNQPVIDYLKNRGMKGETALSFGIGYAPEGWQNLCDYLRKKGYSETDIENAGMAIKSQQNGGAQSSRIYDRFRGRIMFPIFNPSGQIVGFSGRVFQQPGDQRPAEELGGKYLNTPATSIYDKSKILYGFDKAKQEMRKENVCILVEGQMDVVMSHQIGLVNTVAVSGTALTKEHLGLIGRFTDNLILAFDRDKAGMGAADRGVEMALAEGMNVKMAVIPSGKDPADAAKDDPEAWKQAVKDAKNIIEFYVDLYNLPNDFTEKVLPYIAVLPSETEKARWVRKIADKLGIKEEAVWEELKKIKVAVSAWNYDFQGGSRSSLGTTGGDAALQKETLVRVQTLKNRIMGFAIWQQKTEDSDLKETIKEALEKKGLNLEQCAEKERVAFEAEMVYGNTSSLKEEIKKLVFELDKEEIKHELSLLADKIKELESSDNKDELEKNLEQFYKLTKLLNDRQQA